MNTRFGGWLGCGLFFLSLFMGWNVVQGQGILVIESQPGDHWRLPRPSRIPPVVNPPRPVPLLYRVKSLEIEARIKNSVAQCQMHQVFVNEGSQTVEAKCLIPVPTDAAINNVTFMVDGKEIEGKMLPVADARSIYESYVRRSQDPALVQWMGDGLLQTSVFPIPPGKERTVSIGYTVILPKSSGMMDWMVPLKAAGFTSEPVEKVQITAFIEDTAKIGNIYSPTHEVEVQRSGDKTATVKYQSKNNVPINNFRLMAATTSEALSCNWISYAPSTEEEAYFLLLLHPEFDVPKESAPKNVVLVLDKSGSMRGEKMEQARQALLYVLKNLPKNDRIGIVAYDSQVLPFRDRLIDASDADSMQSAASFIQSLSASGGTNIHQGLETSLGLLKNTDRPSFVVHLSDGVATIGVTDERQITANTVRLNSQNARIFNFGVGHDVNSRLMNRLSNECFGQTFFVAPQENIEVAVSKLYDRLGQPALSNVRWELKCNNGEGRVNMLYPAKVHDLFSTEQVSILGRFKASGQAKLVLTGKLGDKEMQFEQVIDLDQSKQTVGSSYVASLWASRRAAGLIDEIDLEGRKPELLQELITLAKKYGVLTEYTAFLAEEPGNQPMAQTQEMLQRRLSSLGEQSGQKAFEGRSKNLSASKTANLEVSERALADSASPPAGAMAGGAGYGGASTRIGLAPGPGSGNLGAGGMGGMVKKEAARVPVKRVGDRAFFFREDKWVDSLVDVTKNPKTVDVERFSEQYFSLMTKYETLLHPLADLDEELLISLDNQVYRFLKSAP